ncbi:MAG: 50S ribosomal protein L18 [Christensenellaceae bacterium]|jgi:large subunit ribosomal protein L18|nr:50S ribosomal protein L18 [Christensenellaceae bacterium]
MLNKPDKNAERTKRHNRLRNKLSGTSDIPRLNVYRSLNNIYSQIIDDEKGVTLTQANSLEAAIVEKSSGKTKVEVAKLVGEFLAEKALSIGVKSVVFDRGGYVYTGRIKALAEGARNGGLEF